MGRISSPCLNKAGYSMFWNNMWDDKHNFSKILCEDEFLRVTMPLVFEDNFSNDLVMYLKKENISDQKLNFYEIFCKNSKPIDIRKWLKLEKVSLFFSKTWILRYQGWIILYIFIYLPVFNNFLVEESANFDFEKSYFNIFFNYYYNLLKISYNNRYLNSQLIQKNDF